MLKAYRIKDTDTETSHGFDREDVGLIYVGLGAKLNEFQLFAITATFFCLTGATVVMFVDLLI